MSVPYTRKIGIVGGVGPHASILFEKKLYQAFSVKVEQDYPASVHINSPSIPDRTKFLLGSGADPAPAINTSLDNLRKLDATLVAMPCNTAHSQKILSRLNLSGLQFINMVAATTKRVENLYSPKKVSVLATTGTIKTNVYDEYFNRLNIEIINPSGALQDQIMKLILCVKNKQNFDVTALVSKLNTYYRQNEVEAIVLGCTELSLVNELRYGNFVDSMDVLVNEVVAACGVRNKKVTDDK